MTSLKPLASRKYPLLKELYTFTEAAVNVKQLLKEDAAVFIDRNSSVFVYNWREVLKTIETSLQKGRDHTSLHTAARSAATETAYAWIAMQTGQSQDVRSVQSSVARKGYGPVAYDMALAISYPKWLTPDQTSLSQAAERVWIYIYNNRPEIEHRLIERYRENIMNNKPIGSLTGGPPNLTSGYGVTDMMRKFKALLLRPWNKGAKEEAEALKPQLLALMEKDPTLNMYRLRGPNKSPMFDALKANHQKFLKQVDMLRSKYLSDREDIDLDQRSIETTLSMAAGSFFNDSYMSD